MTIDDAAERRIDDGQLIAKARDEWFASDEGRKCVNAGTLRLPAYAQAYLRNRLEASFIAGWHACAAAIRGGKL